MLSFLLDVAPINPADYIVNSGVNSLAVILILALAFVVFQLIAGAVVLIVLLTKRNHRRQAALKARQDASEL